MEHSDFFQRVRLAGNPLAHPSATVIRGDARFTVLTDRLLRLEWSPDSVFTDDATFAFPNRYAADPPPFDVRDDGNYLHIDTGALRLAYHLGSGRFTADNLAITFGTGAEEHTWHPGQSPAGNLGGTRRTLDDTGGDVPLEPGLVSRDGWVLFDDSLGVVFPAEDGWVSSRPPQAALDWYFFGFGHAYADALADYTQFGGAVPLIPRYELGIWWSRFWPYSDIDLQQLVTEFADHLLPLDVLVVDMDWHTPGHWTGYTWNSELFPDPEAFLADMHKRRLRVTLNLHPADGVHPHEAAYADFASALNITGADRAPIPFRIADHQFAELYFRLLHHPLEDQGVDFWWIDWQQGESTDIAGLDPLIWLNHLHFADARRRGQRPLLFSRWGGLGNHRYPLGFSGDTFGGWATLAALPRFTATAANVGFGWWSHDIGGHFGATEPELFVRWVQFGALSPCLRLHATKDPLGERRPWAFAPPILEAVSQAFDLRYRLIPYLYTAARRMHDRGSALCRPMYYAFPEQAAAYDAHGQYLLGDDLIAAPITQPADPQTGLAPVNVWIPPGMWYRFDTGEAFAGPRWVRISGDLATIPLLAREGAIVPLAQPALHLEDISRDHLDIAIFPGDDGAFRLYEDDGISEEYQDGAYEWTTFTCTRVGNGERNVRVAPVKGRCPALPAQRSYSLIFVGALPPEQVRDSAGHKLDWSYNPDTQRLQVAVPTTSKDVAIEVAVHWDTTTETIVSLHAANSAPFAHVIANTACDEALAQLGRVILVPPYAGDGTALPCEAESTWRQINYQGVTTITQQVGEIGMGMTLAAPFTAALQAQQWEVQTDFIMGEELVRSVYPGPYIYPPIQRWHVRYAGHDIWNVVQSETTSSTNITDPFNAVLNPQLSSLAEAVANVELAEASTIAFDTWTSGSLSIEVDGQGLDGGRPQPTLAGLARHWPATRFGPHMLEAGRHRITLHLSAPDAGAWVFGVLLVDDKGQPFVYCKEPEA